MLITVVRALAVLVSRSQYGFHREMTRRARFATYAFRVLCKLPPHMFAESETYWKLMPHRVHGHHRQII